MRKKNKALSLKQVTQIRKTAATWSMGNARQRRAALVTRLMLGTGLRVSEARSLRWIDVCSEDKPPYVYVSRGKGGRSRRVLIGAELCAILENARWLLSCSRVYVFATSGREPYSVRTLQRDIMSLLAAAGVTGYHVHCLRHTYATHLYAACNRDVTLVSRQLGHRSTYTTVIYIATILRDVLESLARLYKE